MRKLLFSLFLLLFITALNAQSSDPKLDGTWVQDSISITKIDLKKQTTLNVKQAKRDPLLSLKILDKMTITGSRISFFIENRDVCGSFDVEGNAIKIGFLPMPISMDYKFQDDFLICSQTILTNVFEDDAPKYLVYLRYKRLN